MQTQCLVRGGLARCSTVSVRFLQLVARRVGEFDGPRPAGGRTMMFRPTARSSRSRSATASSPPGKRRSSARFPSGSWTSTISSRRPRWVEFDFAPAARSSQCAAPRRDDRRRHRARATSGSTAGPTSRAEIVGDGLYRLTVRIENRTPFEAGADDRDQCAVARRWSRLIRSSASRTANSSRCSIPLSRSAAWRRHAERRDLAGAGRRRRARPTRCFRRRSSSTTTRRSPPKAPATSSTRPRSTRS